MSDNLYTFKNVSFVVDGNSLCVSSIVIALAENSIPFVRITVDPLHKPGDSTALATAASATLLAQASGRMQQWAVERKLAKLSFDVYKQDAPYQSVSLTDWVVTGAGMSGMLAEGSFAFEIEIAHSLINADSVSLNIDPLNNMIVRNKGTVDSTNMLVTVAGTLEMEANSSAMTNYLPMIDDCPTADVNPLTPQDTILMLLKSLRTGAALLRNGVEWDTAFVKKYKYNNWPLIDCLSKLPTAGSQIASLISFALSSNVLSLIDPSLLSFLLDTLCNEYKVSLLPTYWKPKLSLVPTSQWVAPTLILNDVDVSKVTMPGVDPMAIRGVLGVIADNGEMGDFTHFIPGGAQNSTKVVTVPYMAANLKYGQIVSMSMPQFVTNILEYAANVVDSSVPISKQEENGQKVTDSNGEFGQFQDSASNDMFTAAVSTMWSLMHLAAFSHFLTLFRQKVEISLECRLILKTAQDGDVHGGWLIPGKVCKLMTSGDYGMAEFYITQVTHTISVADNMAGTVVHGCYVRPSVNTGTSVLPEYGSSEAGGPYAVVSGKPLSKLLDAGFPTVLKKSMANPYYNQLNVQ